MISVIIPCYNASRTLKKCVKSVQRQTYRDLEIILVDDCSSDRTLQVCHTLAAADQRIKVVHLSENAGVDKARFEGIDASKGEYLMFADSDDWLGPPDTLQKMIDALEEHDADYVDIGMRRVLDTLGLLSHTDCKGGVTVIENPQLFEDYYLCFFGVNIISVSMCAKLYRRSTIEEARIKPSGLRMGEDLHFNMMLFPHLQRIVLLDTVGYYYRFGGVTTKYNPYLFDNMLRLYQIKKGLIKEHSYDKATDYIIIELINVLRTEICQHLRFSKDPEATKKSISDILALDVWNDVENITEHPQWHTKPLTIAIKNRDAEEAYRICMEIENKNRIPFLLKRIISKILSLI